MPCDRTLITSVLPIRRFKRGGEIAVIGPVLKLPTICHTCSDHYLEYPVQAEILLKRMEPS